MEITEIKCNECDPTNGGPYRSNFVKVSFKLNGVFCSAIFNKKDNEAEAFIKDLETEVWSNKELTGATE